MRKVGIMLSAEVATNPEYTKYAKESAARKLAEELFNDIRSRDVHSVVLISDREWLGGNPTRPELNYEIKYELAEARYADFVGTNRPPKVEIKERFVFLPPKIEFRHAHGCYCKFSWKHAAHGAVEDIRSRIRNLILKAKRNWVKK